MDTIALNPQTWDLYVDPSGNIAMRTGDEAIAQDVASALKTFRGEVYYNTSLGVPYLQSILAHLPPLSFVKAQFNAAALTVPGTLTSACFLDYAGATRVLSGQVQVRTSADNLVVTGFGGGG